MADSKVAAAIAKLEDDGLTVESCNWFLRTYGKVLHPNHAHMLDVKYSLLNLLGHTDGSSMDNLTGQEIFCLHLSPTSVH